MKKKVLPIAILVSLILLAAGVLLFAALTPKVLFVLPDAPESYNSRFSSPSFFGKGYVSFSISESKFQSYLFLDPTVVIWAPMTHVVPGPWKNVEWGVSKPTAECVVTLDDARMWDTAASMLSSRSVGILYREEDSRATQTASSLMARYPNMVGVTYSRRVNSSNKSEVISSLDNLYAFLVLGPEDSSEAYRATRSRAVMDFRDAAAAVTLDRVISVAPDWDSIIRRVFDGESNIPADYTLVVTK